MYIKQIILLILRDKLLERFKNDIKSNWISHNRFLLLTGIAIVCTWKKGCIAQNKLNNTSTHVLTLSMGVFFI